MSWNQPPGTPTGWARSQIELVCRNEDCVEEGTRVEVTQVYERDTGGAWLEPEDADICEWCGKMMEAF